MIHQPRVRAISLILLACLWGGAVRAEKYEVRTFLAPSTGGLTTDTTFQYLQSCVKGRYVCPTCSFSCDTPPAIPNCPDPWGAHAGAVPLQDMGARLRERLLSLAQPTMPAGKFDLELPDAAGVLARRAVLGRPFAPTDNGNTRRSGVYAQVSGLVNANAAEGPIISDTMHGRFLVIPPTPSLREAVATDSAAANYRIPSRRVMGQVEPDSLHNGNSAWAPQTLAISGPGAAAIPETSMGSFLTVGVNPYRVDDGDYWIVRYTEIATGAAPVLVNSVMVEIYSINYGWEGDLDAGNNPTPLVIGDGTTPIFSALAPTFSVLSNSGAVRLTFESTNDDDSGWSTAAGTNVWTCGFMVRSNCRLIPGWRDMRNDATDPRFPLLDNPGSYGGVAGFDYITGVFPPPKQCWFAISPGVPNFTTESNIEETGAPIPVANRYQLPSNATGLGTIAVQWSGDVAGNWTPPPAVPQNAVPYYRSGGEWQYDASFGPTTDLTNAEVAAATDNYGPGHNSHVTLLAGHFLSSRVNLPPTGQQWTPDPSVAGANVEAGAADWRYPREVFGWLNPLTSVVTGNYGPGSVTPSRAIATTNRWDGADDVMVCNTCGAFWNKTGGAIACPYHAPPTVASAWDVKNITDPNFIDYNGRYTDTGTPVNGKPCYAKDAGHFLFWIDQLPAGTVRNVWGLCDTTAPGAWNLVPYRGRVGALGANLPANNWRRRANIPVPRPQLPLPRLSQATDAGPLATLSPKGGGAYTTARETWREAVAFTPDERVVGGAIVKQMLTGSAIRASATGVGHRADWGAPAATQFAVAIPPYQAPSVPGVGVMNNQANDLGYRGGQLLHHNLTAPNASSGLTSGWDAFYRNPDNGYFQPVAGYWPFVCPTDQRVYYLRLVGLNYIGSDGRNYGAVATALVCQHHPGINLGEVGGRHYFCPVCGSEYTEIPANDACPFDGKTIAAPGCLVPLGEAVREEHLAAEEYDAFDIQVSVSRRAEIAQTTPALNLGRTAPGVRSQRPDVTVQPLVNHRAFPGDVSARPTNAADPSDARVTLRNEGNIALSPRLGNANDFNNAAVGDRGLDHYLRLGLDGRAMSYGRTASSGPLTRDTLMPFNATGTPGAAWDVYTQSSGSAAGSPTYGFLSAGSYVGASSKPVPLGQPVGTYTGGNLQYVDTDGDGAFDFFSLAGGAATTSAVAQYNPATDLPLEPLVGVLQGQTRVFETRLPQNDYYALDSDPIVLPSPTAGVMQVMWATNRTNVAGGTAPASLPNSNAGVNLVYMTTAGVTGGPNDELYRLYNWPVDGTGALTPPTAMTTDGAGYVNGLPWVMYNTNDNTRWAFWHRGVRHAGGVESTLRYNTTNNATWPAPGAGNYIYDTGLGKQGMRGFWQPGGAWLFWHSGAPGRERLMYRWNFDATVTNNEAPVPVTNQALAGQTQVPNAAVQGQTDLSYARDNNGVMLTEVIQKPSQSPFTYTKDTSVFNYNNEVNLFFSGLVTHEGQADICWTKYRLASLGPAAATDNYGKLPFARITNLEEMRAEGMHQRYGSRHLDWLVDRNFATAPATGTLNPSFVLQFAFHDDIDGVARGQQTCGVTWTGGTYDRARGTYRVTPVLSPLTAGPVVAGPIPAPGLGAGFLTMDINIAAGTVQFSSPLFNQDAPNDRSAAFTNAITLGGKALDDVILRVNYTPYIYRVTRDEAQDDAPSANYDPSAAQRLTVFWRRSFPTTDAPNFGRAAFMYKVYTTSVQLGRPPSSGATFTNHYGGATVTATASIPDAGIYNFAASDERKYLDVTYTGTNNVGGTAPYTERHQVIGWSREMMVPVDTVMGEGAPVAVPESFGVPRAEGDSNNLIPAMRYWLFWSSPRGVYDLRLVENNGTRLAPGAGQPYDLAVHPSADIHTAVVAPEFGSLAPERAVPTVTNDPT